MSIFNEKYRLKYVFPDSISSPNPITVSFKPGTYVFELFGASGGDGYRDNVKQTTVGGRGGYARGCITFKNTTEVYMYIGGQGTTSNDGETFAPGGFNGGGKGVVGKYNYKVGSGGGATDIRIWCQDLECRKIVAGGGGGAGAASSSSNENVSFGGSGGGLEGIDGKGHASLTDGYKGTGGTQAGPGTGGTTSKAAKDGELGKGGAFEYNGKYFDSSGGGGGGGYYGGGGSGAGGGGGGSGYIDPSIKKNNGFLSALVDGDTETIDLYGRTFTGNVGNGYIHVTPISGNFNRCTKYYKPTKHICIYFLSVILSR